MDILVNFLKDSVLHVFFSNYFLGIAAGIFI